MLTLQDIECDKHQTVVYRFTALFYILQSEKRDQV